MNEAELREALAKTLFEGCRPCTHTEKQWENLDVVEKEEFYPDADKILLLIQEHCYLRGERELPGNPFHYLAEGHYDGYKEAQRVMLQPDSNGVSWKPVKEWGNEG